MRWRGWSIISLLLAWVVVWTPPSAHAQATEELPAISEASSQCPPPQVEPSPNLLVRTLAVEYSLLSKDLCKLVNWSDQITSLENLVVHLFTGPGLHPTAGIIVPDGGFAGGLALNLQWNDTAPLYERVTTSLEARYSVNGFWAAGAQLQALLSRFIEEGQSPLVTLSAKHFDLPSLPFYGLGNDSSLSSKVFYALTETEVSTNLDVPVAPGVTLSGDLHGLWFAPDPSASFDAAFNQTTAPGLHANTTYILPGLSATLEYPRDERLYGLYTSLRVGYGFYQTIDGGSYSFGRLDARWDTSLAVDPYHRFGTLHFVGRLVLSEPYGRNDVPFYLQPTLGGADIHDENLLRSYANYRFRDRNLVAYELSYERQILDPLGIKIFGELGKVGRHPGDLGFDGLKYSAGVGATFRLGGQTFFEISFAWGGGEGMQIYATGNTNNIGAVSAGLRGVF